MLLEGQQVTLTGVILAEILQGARGEAEFQGFLLRTSHFDYLGESKQTWVKAGQLGMDLRRLGRAIPLVDLAIAALALEHDREVYTLDEHFGRVPGLRLYHPPSRRSAT